MTTPAFSHEIRTLSAPVSLSGHSSIISQVEVRYVFSAYGVPETHVVPSGADIVVWRVPGHQDADTTVNNWMTKLSLAICFD